MQVNSPASPAQDAVAKEDLTPRAKIALELCGIAKAEIVTRIRVRDTLLAGYSAAAFTAMSAIAASTLLGNEYLYGVPYLALAFSLLVSYHHAGIGALGTHCATDLFPVFAQEGSVRGFEFSSVFHQYHKKNAARRIVAHVLILLSPPTLALVLNLKDLRAAPTPDRPYPWLLWVLGLLLMTISVAVIYRSNRPHFHGFSPDVLPLSNFGDSRLNTGSGGLQR